MLMWRRCGHGLGWYGTCTSDGTRFRRPPGYLDPVDAALLERIRSLAVTDRVVAGLDFYPTSVIPVGGAAPEWSIHERVAFAVAEFRRWHDRYDVPFWVAETSNLSLGVNDQIPWLLSLTDGLRGLRTTACRYAGSAGTAGETNSTGRANW